MKEETTAFLRKAHDFLTKARSLLEVVHYADEAGRAAYLAGLHAAQALIFERTDKVIKRHRGVHNEFRRLTKGEPRFDPELSAFLARGYNLKAIADYDTDPASAVTVEQAERAIATAQRFIAVIEELLT
ncbi:MAG: HEPN domain-containing protein [Alphaproteobacteria bacterium]|nr:HEPN domain-containing protein [Alphaproteobacteria bacterium]